MLERDAYLSKALGKEGRLSSTVMGLNRQSLGDSSSAVRSSEVRILCCLKAEDVGSSPTMESENAWDL